MRQRTWRIFLLCIIFGALFFQARYLTGQFLFPYLLRNFQRSLKTRWGVELEAGGITRSGFFGFTLAHVVLKKIPYCAREVELRGREVQLQTNVFKVLSGDFVVRFQDVRLVHKSLEVPLTVEHTQEVMKILLEKRTWHFEDLLDVSIVRKFGLSGAVAIGGEVTLNKFSPETINLAFESKYIQVLLPSELRVQCAVKLLVSGSASQPRIEGNIKVARLSFSDELSSLGLFHEQLRLLRQGFLENAILDINIHGTEVLASNDFLEAVLSVYLKCQKERNADPYLLGRIDVLKGTTEVHGNAAQIKKGHAVFVKEGLSPFLAIEAEMKIRKYKILLHIHGTPEDSLLTITSNPELSQNEILSLIALGGGIQADAYAEQRGFTQAEFNDLVINDLLLGKAEIKIARSLGLDDVQLKLGSVQEGGSGFGIVAVEAGKYFFADTVYFSYDVEPSTGTDVWRQSFGGELGLTDHIKIRSIREWDGSSQATVEDKINVEFQWKF